MNDVVPLEAYTFFRSLGSLALDYVLEAAAEVAYVESPWSPIL